MINSVQFNNSKRDFWKEIKNPYTTNFLLEIIVSIAISGITKNILQLIKGKERRKNKRRKKLKFKGRAMADPFLNTFPHLEEHL